MSVTIRLLKADDFGDWKVLYKEYWGSDTTDGHAQAVFTGLMKPENNCAPYAAFEAGHMIGFAHVVYHHCVSDQGKAGFLEDIAVTTAQRKKGIAQKLIDFAIQEAARNGCNRFHWLTNADNTPAKNLYEKYAKGQQWLRYVVKLP